MCVCHIYLLVVSGNKVRTIYTTCAPHPSEIKCCAKWRWQKGSSAVLFFHLILLMCVPASLYLCVCVCCAAGVLYKTNKRMCWRQLNCHAGNSKEKRFLQANFRQRQLKWTHTHAQPHTHTHNIPTHSGVLCMSLSNYFIIPIISLLRHTHGVILASVSFSKKLFPAKSLWESRREHNVYDGI